jgi:hypothetical protein
MSNTFKIIDYVKVHCERTLIDGILYPRYFILEDKKIGIPNGVSFYHKKESAKYIRLTSTGTVRGMAIRYNSKDTQINALLKIIKIQSMQPDTRSTTDLRCNKRSAPKRGINIELPSGVCVQTRKTNNNEYYRVTVNTFNLETMKFTQVELHGGRVDNPIKLQDTLNKAIAMRNASVELAASVTKLNASKAV